MLLSRPLTALSTTLFAPLVLASSIDLTTLSLEQLLDVQVVSASKFAQRASEAPSAMSVITADDIRTYGYRSLGDALRSVRGFDVTSDRRYQFVGVRGFSPPGDFNDRLLVMVDGYRINDNLYDQAFIGSEFPIDLDLVERIEIVHGPSSSVYGSNALFGAVNVITRRGADISNMELSVEAGSDRFGKGRASFGTRLTNGGDLLLSLSGESSRGANLEFQEFATTFGSTSTTGTDFMRNGRLFGKLSLGGATVEAGWSRRNKGNPGALGSSVFDDTRNLAIDEQMFVEGRYAWVAGHTDWTARAFAGAYDYRSDFVTDGALLAIPSYINRDEGQGRWWGGEIKGAATPASGHKLVYGFEYQQNQRQYQTNYDNASAGGTVYLDDSRQSSRAGLYVQDEVALTGRVAVTLGGRLDKVSEYGLQASPRLAAVFRADPATVWKALYGTAFRTPNVGERYASYPNLISPNPDLTPERISTIEFLVEHYWRVDLRLLAAVYDYRLEKQITLLTDAGTGNLQYQNMARVQGRGLEFEAEKLWQGGARLRASLGLRHMRDFNGEWPINAPRCLAKVNYALPLADDWRLGVELQAASARRTNFGQTGGFSLTNLSLSHAWGKGDWQLAASIYNLFDRAYADPVADDGQNLNRDTFAGDRRNFRLKLTYRF